MKSGDPKSQDSFKKRSKIVSIDGSTDIMFNGDKAWNKPVQIDSTIRYSSNPLNYIEDSSFYHNQMKKNLQFTRDSVTTSLQLDITKFTWNPQNFKKDVDTYDSYIEGINNLERFFNIPLICTLPYFDFTPSLLNIPKSTISVDGQSFYDIKKYDRPYFRVERFSGFTVDYNIPIQYNIVLQKKGMLADLLLQDLYVPNMIVTEQFVYSDELVRCILLEFNLIFIRSSQNYQTSKKDYRQRISMNIMR